MSKPSETAKPPASRVADPELQALNKIGVILNALGEHTRTRVMHYLMSRYVKIVTADGQQIKPSLG